MKRIVLSFLLLTFICSLTLSGQSNKSLELGAGVHFTSAHPETFSSYHTNITFYASLNQLANDHLNVRYSLFYQEKGYNINTIFLSSSAIGNSVKRDSILKLRYLTVPVELEYLLNVSKNENLKVGLSVGAYVGYIIGKNWKVKFRNDDKKLIVSREVGEGIKNFDYGITAGISLHFYLFQYIKMTTRLRYDIGLRNIQENSFSDMAFLKTRSAPVTLGWVYEF